MLSAFESQAFPAAERIAILRVRLFGGAQIITVICFAFGRTVSRMAAWALLSTSDQAFQRLCCLFWSTGWLARREAGRHVNGNAQQQHDHGDARLPAWSGATRRVGNVIGQAAGGCACATADRINIQTSDGHMISSTMHGRPVMKTFNTKQKFGTIMVALGTNALFSLSYNGITARRSARARREV